MAELERDLRALAGSVDFPATPDLAARLHERIRVRDERARGRRRLVLALAFSVALSLVLAALAIPQARSAILDFFGIGSVRVELVDRLPEVEPEAPLALGERIDLEDAPFPLLSSSLLGPPDAVFAEGRVVTLLYGRVEGVRLLVTQIDGPGFEPDLAKKIVARDSRAEFVWLASAPEPGLWIAGAPHVVELPGGPPRLAGNTLIWAPGLLTLRLEGAATLAQAVEIAESFS